MTAPSSDDTGPVDHPYIEWLLKSRAKRVAGFARERGLSVEDALEVHELVLARLRQAYRRAHEAAPRAESQGTTDSVAWEVTDLFWQPGKPGHGYDSTFNLLVREIRGVDITFDEIELFFDRQGPFYPYQRRVTGEWRLTAYDQFRIPLGSVVSPFLLGRITLSGHDSQSQPVKAAIELALLDYPPSPPEKTSMSVRAITLTPPATR